MKKGIAAVIFSLIIIHMMIIIPAKAEESDAAYILVEAETGTVLEESDSDKKLNGGYLSKLMALLLIAEDIETGKYSVTSELTASQSVTDTKGAVIWLESGDRLSVDELLKSVIIGNANDALTVLAEKSEGTVEKFTARMNSEAFDIGLRNTVFYSPYGYYDEREYTTAHDVAEICRRLVEYDFMTEYFGTWRTFVKGDSVELVNENTLARTFEPHIGFKACHSEEAGYCIAEAGQNENGAVYISVVLGAADENESLSTAKQLIKSGFSDYKVTAPGFQDELLRPVKVKNGVDSAVEIQLKTQEAVVIPKGVSELSNVIVIPEYLEAPLKKGQKIGTAAFYNGDTLVFETDIIVKNDVERLSYCYILRKFLLNLIEN
jgi:D-alanyl-D-alanine carboxypeptidase (penicillin-binding protein 5/6)